MHKISLNGLKLWLAWNLATIIGLIVSGIILYYIPPRKIDFPYGPEKDFLEFIAYTAGGLLIGLVVGWFQSLVISPKIYDKGKWVWATAIGLALWGGISSVSMMAIPAKPLIYSWIVERIDSLAPFLIGLVIGALQWLVLRQQVKKAGWWVVASTLGWFVPLGLARIVSPSVVSIVTIILVTMVFPGGVTGIALLYFFEGTNIFGKFSPLAVHDETTRKKRFLLLFATFMLLLFGLFTVKAEIDKAYAACSEVMSTREGYGTWKYQETNLFLPEVVFVFSDGCNDAACHVRRNDAGWYVSDVWETLVGCLL